MDVFKYIFFQYWTVTNLRFLQERIDYDEHYIEHVVSDYVFKLYEKLRFYEVKNGRA